MELRSALGLQALADQHCNRGGLDCRWYHGNWELLRSLAIVSSSAVHAKEMGALLGLAGIDGNPGQRILLSGSTDASLLQILVSNLKEGARLAHLVGLDICATPLVLMEDHARDNHLKFSPIKADILEYSPGDTYDAIVTHAFMGNFDEERRVLLVQKWSSLLSETGCVVTVQRVRPEGSAEIIRFSDEQSRSFIDAALAAGKARKMQPAELDHIESAARVFTERFMSHSITSKESLEKLFLDAGFKFKLLEYRSLARMVNLAGPSVPSGGEYAFIIAQRT